MTATTAPIQTCSTCYRRLPIDHFRRRRRDSEERHRQCNTCRNTAERDCRRLIRLHEVDRFAGEVKRARSQRAIERVCIDMIERFGGVAEFTALWWEAIQAAARRLPGSRLVLNHFKAIVDLHRYAVKEREKAGEPLVGDTDQMTTEELNDEISTLIRQEALGLLMEALQSFDDGSNAATG